MPTDLPYAAEAETSLGPEELKVNDDLIRTSCLLVKNTVGERPRSGGLLGLERGSGGGEFQMGRWRQVGK